MGNIFWVFMIVFGILTLGCTGIFSHIGKISFGAVKWVLRIVLGAVLGLGLCFVLSSIGVALGVIGLLGGFLLGIFLPAIFVWLFKSLKWWAMILVVVTLLAALVAAIGSVF